MELTMSLRQDRMEFSCNSIGNLHEVQVAEEQQLVNRGDSQMRGWMQSRNRTLTPHRRRTDKDFDTSVGGHVTSVAASQDEARDDEIRKTNLYLNGR
jgi:urease accessory protein UreE